MRILAIDTATEACSVCFLADGETVSRHTVAPRRHAELLLSWVREVLAEADCALGALDAIAVSHGPGSFTGIRIGFAAAQGLAFGADVGLLGISTLETLAETVRRDHGATSVVAALDARMDELYVGAYRAAGAQWESVMADRVAHPAELERLAGGWTLAGHGLTACDRGLRDCVETAEQLLPDALPDATAVAALAARYLASGGTPIVAELAQPIYLRDRVARKPG